MKTKNPVYDLVRNRISEKTSAAETAWANFQRMKTKYEGRGAALLSDPQAMAELEAASKAYDRAAGELRDAEASLGRVAEAFRDPEATSDTPAFDAGACARAISEWAGTLSSQTLGDTEAHLPHSPNFTLISRRDIRAALMTTSSYPSQAWRRPGAVPLPIAPLSILDVIPIVPVESDIVEILKEKTFTNTAAETAEGSAAPEGTLEFEKVDVQCHWLPFTLPATKQVLSDGGRLRTFVDERLLRGVRDRLQRQVLQGDGAGDNLLGLTNVVGHLIQDTGADIPADVIHKAITKVIVQTKGLWTPQTVMLHPNDFERLVLDKDSNSNYRFGGPQRDGIGTVWGLLPVVNVEVTEGSPWVCDITACELYVREDVTVQVSDSHDGNFTKGIVQFLASGRFGLGVLEPRAFVEITSFDS